jgi:hypothetical protein
MAFIGLLFVSGAIGCLSSAAYGCLTFGIGMLLFGMCEFAAFMIKGDNDVDSD